jgi:drug/metabolite transporter (DMT)-like permease
MVDRPVEDESEEFVDGTFFRRALRSQLVLGAIVVGFGVAALMTSGLPRLGLAAVAVILAAMLVWSGILTYATLLVRKLVHRHLPPPVTPFSS